jgi:hypothetical protein
MRPTRASRLLGQGVATALVPVGGERGGGLDSPDAESLAERFHDLRRQGFRSLVDLSVELGRLLIDARERLRGTYNRWLRERLGVELTTAANYVALARLATESPATVERFKELGTAKLYRVARLPPEARKLVLHNPNVSGMNDRDFATLTRPHLKRTRRVTGTMRAHGMRQKLEAVAETLATMPVPRGIDEELREELRGQLRELSRRALELEQKLR